MSKPFLILNIVEGEVGQIFQRDTWAAAVDVAVKLASEQCGKSEEDIRSELEADTNFVDSGIEVMIAQVEDD